MIKNIKFTVAMIVCAMYCLCIVRTNSANILAILSTPSYSHQVPYRAIFAALSQRGHKVVVVTTDPVNDPSLTNLTEINVHSCYSPLLKIKYFKDLKSDTWLNAFSEQLWPLAQEILTIVYEHPEMRKIYAPDSDEKFDLIIVEVLMTPGFYHLAHRFNAPLIGVCSLGIMSEKYYAIGAPILPSHPSSWEMHDITYVNLSFWQRIKNFIRLWYHIYCVFNQLFPQQQALAEKYLGKDIPYISDIERNISIIFQNQDQVISYIRPQMPNVIPFSGLHLLRKPAPLSKDLERFLTDAPNGFIYVSLGTNTRMSSLSEYVLNIFSEVLASLPCKVLWKMDIELPNKPDNIYIAKWFPQQRVLAHPKIRLFVYQGGLQSTEEAVYYAVPLLGIPIIADQYTQINKMVSLGVARLLDYSSISKKNLNFSIRDILNDKRYKERMLNIKSLIDQKPYNSLDNIIWWIEFVIRHKGAPHLQSSIANDPWYQRYDMDVIAFLSIVIFVTLLCALIIAYKVVKIIFNYYIYLKTSVNKKEKIN